MTANRLPVTRGYLKEFMNGFMTEFMADFMPKALQPIYTRLDGIDATLVEVKSKLGEHDAQFETIHRTLAHHDARLISIDTKLVEMKAKLEEHDDLLETIAAEVSHDQDEIHEFAGVRKDHEKRIMHLERGFMKYMINS